MREITRSVQVSHKRLSAVVLVNVDLPLKPLDFGRLVALRAISGDIFNAFAQKRPFITLGKILQITN